MTPQLECSLEQRHETKASDDKKARWSYDCKGSSFYELFAKKTRTKPTSLFTEYYNITMMMPQDAYFLK